MAALGATLVVAQENNSSISTLYLYLFKHKKKTDVRTHLPLMVNTRPMPRNYSINPSARR
jgi:hypothetical protein